MVEREVYRPDPSASRVVFSCALPDEAAEQELRIVGDHPARRAARFAAAPRSRRVGVAVCLSITHPAFHLRSAQLRAPLEFDSGDRFSDSGQGWP